MDVKLEDHWKGFVEHEVDRGRFESADAVVAEGLRLVEERETKLKALRDVIETSLRRGGERRARTTSIGRSPPVPTN